MESKTVLITGAKGGLGSALVHVFVNNGWQVISTDLKEKIAENNNSNSWIRETAMDVRSDESVSAVALELQSQKQQVDVIINNAGVDNYFPLCEMPVVFFKEVFEVNIFGSYRVNQIFLPLLRKPGGHIIHISSESVKINVPFMTYPITKQTLEGYSRTLRQELRFLGISVTLIRPGAINTPFLENARNMKNPVPASILKKPFEKFALQAPGEIGKTLEPAVVADYIYRIACMRKTRAVYQINNSLLLSIASMLPFSLVEKMVYKRLK